MTNFSTFRCLLAGLAFAFGLNAPGEKSPIGPGESEKKADKSKENVTKLVTAGYEFVIEPVKKMTPAQMNEPVKVFGQFDMIKGMALTKVFEPQTHHREQATVYLRLAGVKPPKK